mmetsp:Transcript_3439/g.8079  ORF Transcript_3439/g.8079 Transcript_3439/m.8079 type:complete len:486 (+) Transcript_3439:2235-3692(+)
MRWRLGELRKHHRSSRGGGREGRTPGRGRGAAKTVVPNMLNRGSRERHGRWDRHVDERVIAVLTRGGRLRARREASGNTVVVQLLGIATETLGAAEDVHDLVGGPRPPSHLPPRSTQRLLLFRRRRLHLSRPDPQCFHLAEPLRQVAISVPTRAPITLLVREVPDGQRRVLVQHERLRQLDPRVVHVVGGTIQRLLHLDEQHSGNRLFALRLFFLREFQVQHLLVQKNLHLVAGGEIVRSGVEPAAARVRTLGGAAHLRPADVAAAHRTTVEVRCPATVVVQHAALVVLGDFLLFVLLHQLLEKILHGRFRNSFFGQLLHVRGRRVAVGEGIGREAEFGLDVVAHDRKHGLVGEVHRETSRPIHNGGCRGIRVARTRFQHELVAALLRLQPRVRLLGHLVVIVIVRGSGEGLFIVLVGRGPSGLVASRRAPVARRLRARVGPQLLHRALLHSEQRGAKRRQIRWREPAAFASDRARGDLVFPVHQ